MAVNVPFAQNGENKLEINALQAFFCLQGSFFFFCGYMTIVREKNFCILMAFMI